MQTISIRPSAVLGHYARKRKTFNYLNYATRTMPQEPCMHMPPKASAAGCSCICRVLVVAIVTHVAATAADVATLFPTLSPVVICVLVCSFHVTKLPQVKRMSTQAACPPFHARTHIIHSYHQRSHSAAKKTPPDE